MGLNPFKKSSTTEIDDERLEALIAQTEEAVVDNELLRRQAEDLAYTVLQGYNSKNSQGAFEFSYLDRVKRNEQAEKALFENNVLCRAVEINNDYVWGRGLEEPLAADPRVQRVISAFWNDPDNKLVLTSFFAQVEKGTDLTLYSELFFIVFDDGEWGDLNIEVVKREDPQADPGQPSLPKTESAEEAHSYIEDLSGGQFDVTITGPLPESAVKLSDIHPNEIVDIISDAKNAKRPRYFKRIIEEFVYDYDNDRWINRTKITGDKYRYYEALLYPPLPDQPRPPQNKIGQGKVVHFAIHKTSFHKRGNSEVWRSIKWANALEAFFAWRLTLLRALSSFTYKRKVKGGSNAVLQAALRMSNAQAPNATGLPGEFDPIPGPRPGSIITENQNEDLSQFKTTSGASEATQDALALRSQVGVGFGLPPHYIGDVGSANLANATQMEVPVLKRFESRQEFFETVVRTFLDYAIQKAVDDGRIPDDANLKFKVEMPNILQRNIPELVNATIQLGARLDPYAINLKLKRWIFHQCLTYLGVPEPRAIVDQVYPPGMKDEPMIPGLLNTVMPNSTPPSNGNGSNPNPDGLVDPSNMDPMKNKKTQAKVIASAFETEIREILERYASI